MKKFNDTSEWARTDRTRQQLIRMKEDNLRVEDMTHGRCHKHWALTSPGQRTLPTSNETPRCGTLEFEFIGRSLSRLPPRSGTNADTVQ